jgi:hypothetical protein
MGYAKAVRSRRLFCQGHPDGNNLTINETHKACLASQLGTTVARCTGSRSRIRNTLRLASWIRRCRKQISVGASIAPSSTIQRNSPLLLTAAIRPGRMRRWLGRTTGASFRAAHSSGHARHRRATRSRRPTSSSRAVIAAYSWRSQCPPRSVAAQKPAAAAPAR